LHFFNPRYEEDPFGEIDVLGLYQETLDKIHAHAISEFPYECCGIILSDGDQEFVRVCRNIQNARHAEDPETYTRDARTAYLIDPNDLISVHKESETENRQIKAFYHSHPNHDAYFSAKDKDDAMAWGEPTYPDAAYIVISICNRAINTTRAYAWREAEGDFVEVPINVKRGSL
jgi:proteasome lid subunit RPN8/RPN11